MGMDLFNMDTIKNIKEYFSKVEDSYSHTEEFSDKMAIFNKDLEYLSYHPFIYSLLAGCSIYSPVFLSKILFNEGHGNLKDFFETFLAYLGTGKIIAELYGKIQEIDSSYTYWATAFRSPSKVFYQVIACRFFIEIYFKFCSGTYLFHSK